MASSTYSKQRVAKAAEKIITDNGGIYHQPLLDNLADWNRARIVSSNELQTGFGDKQKEAVNPSEAGRTLQYLTGAPQLDFTRFLDKSTIEEITATGQKIEDKRKTGASLERKKGKIIGINEGLAFGDGSKILLEPHIQEMLAKNIYDVEVAHGQRANLIYPLDVQFKIGYGSGPWDELQAGKKNRYYQAAYELSIALHYLERASPAEYYSIVESSKTMGRLTSGKVEPYLTGLTKEFLDDFCIRQKDVAYTWRNMLAPAGSKANPPVFSKSYIAFTNQMGLGTIEFLLTSGRDVLDYLRNFGQEMQRQPYRRTEIKDEHNLEIMPGVPLQEGKYLLASPEVLLHIAREHHELWRFCRELSWLFPDKEMHWPPRVEHIPFKELPIPTKNKDMIAALGVVFMIGTMPQDKYDILKNAAAEGNPLNFPLTRTEVTSGI